MRGKVSYVDRVSPEVIRTPEGHCAGHLCFPHLRFAEVKAWGQGPSPGYKVTPGFEFDLTLFTD